MEVKKSKISFCCFWSDSKTLPWNFCCNQKNQLCSFTFFATTLQSFLFPANKAKLLHQSFFQEWETLLNHVSLLTGVESKIVITKHQSCKLFVKLKGLGRSPVGKETFDRRTVQHFLFDNEVSYQVLLCKAHLIIIEIHLGDCNCQPYSNCQIIKSPSRLRFLGGSGPLEI